MTVSDGIADSTDTLVIDVTPASISIGDAEALEQGGDLTSFTFTVVLESPVSNPISVDYVTSDGTATSGGTDPDYFAQSGTITFASGQVSQQVTIDVAGDALIERNETFFVALQNLDGGGLAVEIADGVGTGLILNDDGPAVWSIEATDTVAEGDAADLTIQLTGRLGAGETASIDLSSLEHEASASDYQSVADAITSAVTGYVGPGSLTFDGTTLIFTASGDGDQMTPLRATVFAIEDGLVEPTEAFAARIDNPGSSTGINVVIAEGTDQVDINIVDDDALLIEFSSTESSAGEGGIVDAGAVGFRLGSIGTSGFVAADAQRRLGRCRIARADADRRRDPTTQVWFLCRGS
ncbi:MAG: Calx-beta domain-containing protein [Pirellulaceae bacterium]